VGHLAHLLGLMPTAGPVPAGDLVDGFDLTRLTPRPRGIRVDPATWPA